MKKFRELPLTPRAKNILDYATEEAFALGHEVVGTEHLLLGIMREQDGVAFQLVVEVGLNLFSLRETIIELYGRGKQQPEWRPPVRKRSQKGSKKRRKR